MRGIIFVILLVLIAPGCDIRQREEALKKRETELTQKEQQLITKEKALQQREELVLLRELKLDSSRLDSVQLNPALQGQWSVKMVCTETTCAGSAVGDTKNEIWVFSIEHNLIIARVMTDNKISRTYIGTYMNGTIELVDNVAQRANEPATKIVVRINSITNNSMSGIREIVRPDCKIVYSLQLNQ